jgi:hypothetical protein
MNEVIDDTYLLKREAQGSSVKNIPFHHFDRAIPGVRGNPTTITNETPDAIFLLQEPRYQLRTYVTARTNNENACAGVAFLSL